MREHSFCYTSSLISVSLFLVFFLGANILSEASPLPSGTDYEPSSKEPLDLKGPLSCHGNLTSHPLRKNDSPLLCDGGIFCQGVTSCNGTLVCSQDWINLGGTLACNGELSCNGTLTCKKDPAHPACLPGLGRLPPPLLAISIVFLVFISGGLGGLKSAFMSIDPMDLRVVMDTGTTKERILAERIYEARQHSESTTLMLCAMTLTTVVINHSLPLMAACLLNNHLWGFLLSSALVVMFGEILPLIVFPRFPLLILGNMMWAIYVATSIFCIPACLLSYIYESTISLGPGRSKKTLYNNKELGSLVDLHAARTEAGGELSIDAVRVLYGALEMEKRVARDIMKPLDEVKMKSLDARMDFHGWAEISNWGYSRIPIYKPLDNNQDTNTTYSDFNIKVMGFLYAFDLIFVIVDEIATLKQLPLHKLPVISEDYPLWDLLRLFQEGASHMAIVERGMEAIEITDSPVDPLPRLSIVKMAKREWQRIQTKLCPCRSKPPTIQKPRPLYTPNYWTDDKDYLSSRGKPIGIVTLEDVIEALLQSSILDEKDISSSRRRIKGTGSPDSSRIITSSEQTPISSSTESLPTNHRARQAGLYNTGQDSANETNYQPKKATSENFLHAPSLGLEYGRSERRERGRRVSFPDGYLAAPYLGANVEILDGRDFKSKTFPRTMDYGKTRIDRPEELPLIDLLSEEELSFVTISEYDMDTRDGEGHTPKRAVDEPPLIYKEK